MDRAKSKFYIEVVPATLLFRNVHDFNMDAYLPETLIDTITRLNPVLPKNAAFVGNKNEYDWTIEMTTGESSFKLIGFTQYGRGNPKLSDQRALTLQERGGISFQTVVAV